MNKIYLKDALQSWNIYNEADRDYHVGSYSMPNFFYPKDQFCDVCSNEKEKWIRLLNKALNAKVSVASFADDSVCFPTAEYLVDNVLINKDSDFGPEELEDFALYKIVHSTIGNDIPKVKACIKALSYGVHIIDKVPNVVKYDLNILETIALGASKGVDVCNLIEPGITEDNLKTYIYSHI